MGICSMETLARLTDDTCKWVGKNGGVVVGVISAFCLGFLTAVAVEYYAIKVGVSLDRLE